MEVALLWDVLVIQALALKSTGLLHGLSCLFKHTVSETAPPPMDKRLH